MKNIKSFDNFLNERLMDVSADVDFIYNKYFKEFYDYIKQHNIININLIKSGEFPTSELSSPLCKKADSLNPCTIYINKQYFFGSYYKPIANEISIKMNSNAIDYVSDYPNIDKACDALGATKGLQLKHEFLESSIKGTIHHELVHWIDDTLHNRYLLKKLSNRTSPIKHVDSKFFEIQSQIHTILQLKKSLADIWDEISFNTMIKYSASLTSVFNKLPVDERKIWIKKLKSRMFREGLLGKNMK